MNSQRLLSRLTFLCLSMLLLLCVSDAKIVRDATKQLHKGLNTALNISSGNISESFGKTHFIVGYPHHKQQDIKKQSSEKQASTTDESFDLVVNGQIRQVFFAPDDSVHKLLLHLIKNEKKSIKIAAFSFTDGDIAKALLDAIERGVKVQMVVDPKCVKDDFNKVEIVHEHGAELFVYDPYYNSKKKGLIVSIMHHKIMLFEQNILDKSIMVTGSLNFTKSAHIRNQENIVVMDDEQFISKYLRQYDVLKTRSKRAKTCKSGNCDTVVVHE